MRADRLIRGSRRAVRRIVLKSAYKTRRVVNALLTLAFWRRERTVQLETVMRRLELTVAALYHPGIVLLAAPRNVWTRERVRRLASRDPRARETAAAIDGEKITLPAELSMTGSRDETIARYRLLAIEQAERIVRGTAAHPSTESLVDPLERDLYLLREGLAIDAGITRRFPGLASTLRAERAASLARRPRLEHLTPVERAVERLLRESLATTTDAHGDASIDPEQSVAWARETATRVRNEQRGAPSAARYRGLPLASLWGTVRFTGVGTAHEPTADPGASHALFKLGEGEGGKPTEEAEIDREASDSSEERGDRHDPDAPPDHGEDNDLATRQSESPDRPNVTGMMPDAAGGTSRTGAQGPQAVLTPEHARVDNLPPAIPYEEWDSDSSRYVKNAALVRLYHAADGDEQWSRTMLRQHGALVRQLRQQFERLRAQRALLRRQPSGDELDIDACVNAIVDRRIGASPSDRLYLDARPARRGLAIALLVDVSGSTAAPVSDDLRIIDLEKLALLIATEALDALGDLFAIQTFAGRDSTNVRLTTIKGFDERSGEAVRRRIAALEPGGFTRLGAAVRHATHELARQSAGHRLLLLLSDGRPNDVDRYQGTYGVEDARQAILQARASGVYPFCLTVDRNASEYLPRIFGQAGHTILQRPAQLPTALVTVVRALIRQR